VNNLISRTITGIFFVVAIIGSILIGHILFSVLFLIITVATLTELFQLLKKEGKTEILFLPGVVLGGVFFILASLSALHIIPLKYLLLGFSMPAILFIIELYRRKENPFLNVSVTLTGMIYVVLPFSILNFLLNPSLVPGEYHPANLIGFFVILWTYDTFAYLTGMLLGRNRLFERISPKKSWEGVIGGLLFGLFAAWIVAKFSHENDFVIWAVQAIVIVIFGTFGDLVESLLKRSLNIKDSGKLLPGHGGLLDRFDAVLFAAPAVFVYYLLI
jgi:phosphatidate cytidylyltransferase